MRELGYDEENLAIEFLNVPSPAEYPKAYQEWQDLQPPQ
jgi:hypothetical protein